MDVRRTALAVLLVSGALAVVVGLLWHAGPVSSSRGAGSVRPAAAVRTPERVVLDRWDLARAAAWSRGSVLALRSLYVPGSSVGRADVALLRRYRHRGLRVAGLRTQVLAWSVVSSRSDRLVLRVTDRLVGGVAVRAAGGTRARLPVDRPSERVVTFVRRDGRWLVARVA